MQAAGKYFVFVAKKDGDKLSAKQVEIEVLGIEGDKYQVESKQKPSDRIGVTTGILRSVDAAPNRRQKTVSGKNRKYARR